MIAIMRLSIQCTRPGKPKWHKEMLCTNEEDIGARPVHHECIILCVPRRVASYPPDMRWWYGEESEDAAVRKRRMRAHNAPLHTGTKRRVGGEAIWSLNLPIELPWFSITFCFSLLLRFICFLSFPSFSRLLLCCRFFFCISFFFRLSPYQQSVFQHARFSNSDFSLSLRPGPRGFPRFSFSSMYSYFFFKSVQHSSGMLKMGY